MSVPRGDQDRKAHQGIGADRQVGPLGQLRTGFPAPTTHEHDFETLGIFLLSDPVSVSYVCWPTDEAITGIIKLDPTPKTPRLAVTYDAETPGWVSQEIVFDLSTPSEPPPNMVKFSDPRPAADHDFFRGGQNNSQAHLERHHSPLAPGAYTLGIAKATRNKSANPNQSTKNDRPLPRGQRYLRVQSSDIFPSEVLLYCLPAN